jgi:O-antigen/teichoic acid export membrane protein
VINKSAEGALSQKENPQSHHLSESNSDNNKDILTAAKGGGIAFAGMLFGYGIRFVFSIIVARILGAEEWGLYALGFTVITTLSTLALLGLPAGVVRYVPIANRQRVKTDLWGIIQYSIALPALISFIFASVVFILAEPLSNQLFNEPRLTPVLRLISVGIPLLSLITITESITRGFKQIQYEVYADNVIFNLVKLFISIVLLYWGLRVMGVIIAHIAASILTLGLLIYFVNTLFPLNKRLDFTKFNPRELLRFSLPVYSALVVETLGKSLGTLLLGFLGMTLGVGIYSAALRLSNIGDMFYLSIGAISAPIISDLYSLGERNQLERFYQTTARWATMFNLPIFVTFVLFSTSLLSIFGTDFTAGGTGLVILAFGPLASAITGLCGTVINMTGHTKLTFLNSSLYLFSSILFSVLFIPRWGVAGAALAESLSIVIRNVIQLLEVYYLHRILPYNWSILKPLTAGVMAAGITYLINVQFTFHSPLVQFTVGLTLLWSTYSLILVLLKFSEEDRLVFDQIRLRLNLKNPVKK